MILVDSALCGFCFIFFLLVVPSSESSAFTSFVNLFLGSAGDF